jgi:transcriptional regulator of arginine metabolism
MQQPERHQVILELIAAKPISRQGELASLLTEKGYNVTQASVSRDLEKLGVTKVNGRYVRRPAIGFGTFGPVSFNEAGENLIVIKCGSGLASAAAVRIDSAAIGEIVGTIAGDDTIFVAVRNGSDQKRTIRSLRDLLETNEGNGNN